MKIIFFIIMILMGNYVATAQVTAALPDTVFRNPLSNLTVDENNIVEFNIPINATTHIVSPEPILYVDISTPKVEGDIQEKNILRIKPAEGNGGIIENQAFTVTIVTRTFVAIYKLYCTIPARSGKENSATTYVISIDPNKAVQLNQANALTQQQCYAMSMQALSKRRRIFNLKANAYDLSLWINNIYIVGDYLLFDIGAKNKSKLPFDIDQVRFKIKDKFKVNAAISQDIELQPMFRFYSNEDAVITGSWRNFYIFKKFTYPTQKVFSMELNEQQISGRKIDLKIEYNQVLKSQFLQ